MLEVFRFDTVDNIKFKEDNLKVLKYLKMHFGHVAYRCNRRNGTEKEAISGLLG